MKLATTLAIQYGFFLLLIAGNVAFARVIPDAGSLLQQQQNLEHLPQAPLDKSQIQEQVPIKEVPTDQVAILVHTFLINGDITAFTHERLHALLEDHINKQLSISDLQHAASIITDFYREQGYFLARAFLPQQDITEGSVTITVQEGLLDANDGILINGNELRLNTDFAGRIMSNRLRPNKALNKEELERGILLLNDLHGVTATSRLKPGSLPGTTRILVNIEEAAIFNSSLNFDNYGSRYTGSNRVTANLFLNNLTGYGDQLSLSGTKSTNGDFNYIHLNYSLFLGTSGLRVDMMYSYLDFAIGKELKLINSKGDAKNWTINFRYPLIRTRKQSFYVTAGYDRKDLYNETSSIATSDKKLDIVNIGLRFKRSDNFFGGGYTLVNAAIRIGDLDLSDNTVNLEQDQSASGLHTQGGFEKLLWSTTRVQFGSDRLTFLGMLHGQFASKNLDSSERFQLGGATGVRAYPSGEATGDDGVRSTIEAHYRLHTHPSLGIFNVQVFYDWGYIRRFYDSRRLNLTSNNSYSISSYGFGLSLSKAQQYNLRLQWAHKIGSNPFADGQGNDSDGKNNKSRFWLNFSAYF